MQNFCFCHFQIPDFFWKIRAALFSNRTSLPQGADVIYLGICLRLKMFTANNILQFEITLIFIPWKHSVIFIVVFHCWCLFHLIPGQFELFSDTRCPIWIFWCLVLILPLPKIQLHQGMKMQKGFLTFSIHPALFWKIRKAGFFASMCRRNLLKHMLMFASALLQTAHYGLRLL